MWWEGIKIVHKLFTIFADNYQLISSSIKTATKMQGMWNSIWNTNGRQKELRLIETLCTTKAMVVGAAVVSWWLLVVMIETCFPGDYGVGWWDLLPPQKNSPSWYWGTSNLSTLICNSSHSSSNLLTQTKKKKKRKPISQLLNYKTQS